MNKIAGLPGGKFIRTLLPGIRICSSPNMNNMALKYHKFIIICSLLLAQFLIVKAASAVVGTSCTRSGSGITMAVNIIYIPGDGWPLSNLTNQMNQVYTPELNRVWNQNFKTSDCSLPVQFVFTSKTGSSCSEAPGFHCIKIYHNASIRSYMEGLSSFEEPTNSGSWYYESSNSGTNGGGVAYCTTQKQWSCEQFRENIVAHEIGHALGIDDEYQEHGSGLEKNIMGYHIDCFQSSTGDTWKAGPTINQIDKMVQEFCKGKDAVCTKTEATDKCGARVAGNCLSNRKCPTNDPSCKNAPKAETTQPPAEKPPEPVIVNPNRDLGKLELQVPIFEYAFAISLPEYIFNMFRNAMFVIVLLTIIMVMWGGIQWIAAAGNSPKIAIAKKQISSAFVGMLLALLSYVLLSFIGITRLYLPTIETIAPMQGSPLTIEGGGGDMGGCKGGETPSTPAKP